MAISVVWAMKPYTDVDQIQERTRSPQWFNAWNNHNVDAEVEIVAL